jgi:hypothetical protein
MEIVRITDENSGFNVLALVTERISRNVPAHFVSVDIDKLHTKADIGMSERAATSHGGIKALA